MSEKELATSEPVTQYFGDQVVTKIEGNEVYLENNKFPLYLADVFLEWPFKLITETPYKEGGYEWMVAYAMGKITKLFEELNFDDIVIANTLQRTQNSIKQTYETSIAKKYGAAGTHFIRFADVAKDGVDPEYY